MNCSSDVLSPIHPSLPKRTSSLTPQVLPPVSFSDPLSVNNMATLTAVYSFLLTLFFFIHRTWNFLLPVSTCLHLPPHLFPTLSTALDCWSEVALSVKHNNIQKETEFNRVKNIFLTQLFPPNIPPSCSVVCSTLLCFTFKFGHDCKMFISKWPL